MKIAQYLRQYEAQILSEKKIKAGLRAEELREKLDPEAAVVGLMSLGEQAKVCDLVDLPRLQFQAQILTTILKKCMPDLRTLEVKDSDNRMSTLVIDMSGLELETGNADFGREVVSDTANKEQ